MYLPCMIVLCLVVFGLDYVWHTDLMKNWKFWAMQLFTTIMVILFDLYAVGRIWFFAKQATIGITIFNTPIENMLFGFAMIGSTLVLFERSQQHTSNRNRLM